MHRRPPGRHSHLNVNETMDKLVFDRQQFGSLLQIQKSRRM